MLENYGVVILGRRELAQALENLPSRVVKKIMDSWAIKQARELAKIARMSAPRDRSSKRRKPDSARLWRVIRASPVRRLKKFPGAISRAIAYGAVRQRSNRASSFYRVPRGKTRRRGSGQYNFPLSPVARHFHLAVLGTAERVQKTTGRRTGKMWGKSPDPMFWQRASAIALRNASGEVGASLRDAYDREIQKEINRLVRTRVTFTRSMGSI